MIKYPDISVQLSTEDGNAYSIMARVTTAMRRAGIPKKKQDEYQKEAMAGDYDNLIQVTMRWVEVA
jgi:hypothetical protein